MSPVINIIPNYSDIFDDENTEEQEYIATIMMKNLDKKKTLET